jgi:hypothetical protein
MNSPQPIIPQGTKMFRIRFHLGLGKHYKSWQISNKSEKIFIRPEEYSLIMYNCQLINKKNIAKKIFQGQNKTVCAWVLCERFELSPILNIKNLIYYNPRIAPHWTDEQMNDLDNLKFEKLYTHKKYIGIEI